jgi:dUTP pyrophosphatase
MSKVRGFEVVADQHRTAKECFTDEKKGKHYFPVDITLPTRADPRSAGYDFYLPKDLKLLPMQKTIVFTDVKAYMQPDEVLEIYIRSSLAIKNGLMLSNNVGIIDSSYYENEANDGNIGICLYNMTDETVHIDQYERIAQGIFLPFLVSDNGNTDEERQGGIGSTNK